MAAILSIVLVPPDEIVSVQNTVNFKIMDDLIWLMVVHDVNMHSFFCTNVFTCNIKYNISKHGRDMDALQSLFQVHLDHPLEKFCVQSEYAI